MHNERKSPAPPGRVSGGHAGLLTEAKKDLVLLPLQVELVHLQQRLKLLPVDVVQNLLDTHTQERVT